MENWNIVPVTTDNWNEVVDLIDWRQPEAVDTLGNRLLRDHNGKTTFQIPFDVWYDTRAYEKPWRRFMERSSDVLTS